MSATATTAKPKPEVKDSKGTTLERLMKVVIPGDDKKVGTITGIEYQRARVVILPDGESKKIVRPAGKIYVQKSRSGKIQRAVQAGRKASAAA